MNEKYYFENSFCIMLTYASQEIIEEGIKGRKCKICGSNLILINYMDGSCVICPKDLYGHPNFGIDVDGNNHKNKPKVIWEEE